MMFSDYFLVAFIAILLTLIAFLSHRLWKLSHSSSPTVMDKIRELSEKNNKLSLQLKEKEDSIKNLRLDEYKKYAGMLLDLIESFPKFTEEQTIAEQHAMMDNYMKSKVLTLPGVKFQAYPAYARKVQAGAEAYALLMKLKEFMNEAQKALQLQDTPLTEEQKRDNIDLLFRMAMICFDNITTFREELNKRDEQRINCDYLYQRITITEALSQAKIMTNSSLDTPRWIRVIKSSIEAYGIQQSKAIFSGYKQE